MLRIITNLKILKLMFIVVVIVSIVLKLFVHFYSKIYKTNDDIESEELVKGIHNTILEIIKKREEKVMTGEGSSFGGDFLQLLVEAHHDANASLKISIEDLVDECKIFYIAGKETTSTCVDFISSSNPHRLTRKSNKGGAQFIWPTKSKPGWNHKTQDCKNVSNSNQLLV